MSSPGDRVVVEDKRILRSGASIEEAETCQPIKKSEKKGINFLRLRSRKFLTERPSRARKQSSGGNCEETKVTIN